MPKIFGTIDKLKPIYDAAYKIVMFICKLLLVTDILITSYAVLGRFCQQLAKHYEFLQFLSVIKDPAWSEEVVLTLMTYMAVLSAALAIRRGAHIRMTALDGYLPKKLVRFLDLLADVAVFALAIIMLVVGWQYATTIGARGTYVSMPKVSRIWMYLPIPLAGVAMIVFEIEALYNHVKALFVKEDKAS